MTHFLQFGRFQAGNPREKISRELVWLTVTFLVMAAPFFFRPFHIDARAFILPHTHILGNPLSPYNFQVRYINGKDHLYFSNMPHPPLVPYLIALVSYLSGSVSESILHSVFLCFPLVALTAMYFLSREFSPQPALATLLLILTPAFMTESGKVTSDMPGLALFLTTIAAYVQGSRKDPRFFYLSIFSANLLFITRYSGFLVLPILFLFSVLEKIPVKKTTLRLSFFLISFLFWTVQNVIVHGVPHFMAVIWSNNMFPVVMPPDGLRILHGFIAMTSHISGSTLFLLLVPVFVLGRRLNAMLLAVSLGIACMVLRFHVPIPELPYQFLFILFFGIGLFYLLLIIRNFPLNTDPTGKKTSVYLFLSGWFLLVWIFNNFILSFSCARYNLPLIPPLILLLLNGVGSRKIFDRGIKVIIPLMALFSLVISRVDYDLASSYQRFCRRISAEAPYRRIWTTNLWGMSYYLPKYHPKTEYFDRGKINKGDLVVVSTLASFFSPNQESLVPLQENVYFSALPIKLLDHRSHAGFYSNGWGPLPFSFSRGEIERIKTYEVMDIVAKQTLAEKETGLIGPSGGVGQTFVCKENGLSAIKVRLSISAKRSDDVIFRLKDSPDDASDLARVRLSVRGVEDDSWHIFQFPPLADSEGKTFYFSVESNGSGQGGNFKAWKSMRDRYPGGTFYENGAPGQGDLDFIALSR